jgi:hypothetical protein
VHAHRHHDHGHHSHGHHDHGHGHGHDDYGRHGHYDHQLGASPAGSVMLDIGPDTGALIIHTTEREHLQEIEISPGADVDAPRTHAAVRERILPDRVLHAAVYPRLRPGTYTIWRDATTPHGVATIAPASVVDYVYAERPVYA